MQTAINHIAAACAAADIKNAIICPGSRNAPLTMAFVRHPDIECHSVVDERSAGFIALGMSQRSGQPTVLICTSGSAVVNFYPAVVEAFYQRVPLLIITADRPPELIDQWDGQTMHQSDVFGKHVKASHTLPDDYSVPEIFSQTTLQGHRDAVEGIKGPVHINVPLREPLYEARSEKFNYPEIDYPPSGYKSISSDISPLKQAVEGSNRVILFNGAGIENDEAVNAMKSIADKVAVLSDVVSNRHTAANIRYWDFITSKKELHTELQPDVLITTGTSTVSKNLKLFLRQHKPQHHFHISPTGDMADPFQTSPQLVQGEVGEVLNQLSFNNENSYLKLWQQWDEKIESLNKVLFDEIPFTEFSALRFLMFALPNRSRLQLANSMAVRWVNLFRQTNLVSSINSNRGVSGIDGCTSTAVGAAFAAKNGIVTLITGDVAFFYDSNALWNKFAPANLRIVVLNNSGGGIFRLIDGPGQMPELGKYLETQHQRTAQLLAKDMGVEYSAAHNYEELAEELKNFYSPSNKPKVLEVFTTAEINTTIFNEYKQLIHGLEKI